MIHDSLTAFPKTPHLKGQVLKHMNLLRKRKTKKKIFNLHHQNPPIICSGKKYGFAPHLLGSKLPQFFVLCIYVDLVGWHHRVFLGQRPCGYNPCRKYLFFLFELSMFHHLTLSIVKIESKTLWFNIS